MNSKKGKPFRVMMMVCTALFLGFSLGKYYNWSQTNEPRIASSNGDLVRRLFASPRKQEATTQSVTSTGAPNTTTKSSSQSFDVQMAEEQVRRRQRITAACMEYGISSDWAPENVNDYAQHFLVNDEYKILINYIPKVSCSTWKGIFRDLFVKTRNLSESAVVRDPITMYLRFSKLNSDEQKIYKLRTYKKVLFVREPFNRALSAFLSKFHPPNDPDLQARWEDWYGQGIASMYRPGYTPNNITQVDPSNPVNSTLYNFLDIKLSEFIRYICDKDKQYGRNIPINTVNDHWLHMYRVSNACAMKYDFIGYYENLAIEGPYVLRWLGVDHLVKFPDVHISRASQTFLNEYRKIPLELLERLWKYYQIDYEMFGYSINDTLNNLMGGLFEK